MDLIHILFLLYLLLGLYTHFVHYSRRIRCRIQCKKRQATLH